MGQTILAATGRTVPSLKGVANSAVVLEPNAPPTNSRVFLDLIPTVRAAPVTETSADPVCNCLVTRPQMGRTRDMAVWCFGRNLRGHANHVAGPKLYDGFGIHVLPRPPTFGRALFQPGICGRRQRRRRRRVLHTV